MLKMEALRSFETSITSFDTPHNIPEDLNWYRTVESRLGGGARFTAPDQTGPGAHPAFYAMGNGSLLGVERPRRRVDQPPSSVEVKERVESYLYSTSGPS